jgi:hypothetical protein
MKQLIHCPKCSTDVKAYNPTVRRLLSDMKFRYGMISGICVLCSKRYHCLVKPNTFCLRPAISPTLTVDKLYNIMEKDRIPFERIIKVIGTALRPYRCDSCNTPIDQHDNCTAITVIARGQQYHPWEEEFITITGISLRFRRPK